MTFICRHCGAELWRDTDVLKVVPADSHGWVHADESPFCDHSTLSVPVVGEAM